MGNDSSHDLSWRPRPSGRKAESFCSYVTTHRRAVDQCTLYSVAASSYADRSVGQAPLLILLCVAAVSHCSMALRSCPMRWRRYNTTVLA